MAFSTAQEQYIKTITASMLKQYPEGSYIAWNTSTSNSNKYDLHIVFATDNISFSADYLDEFNEGAYFFECTGSVIQYDIITSNISGNNPDYLNRVSVSSLSQTLYNIAVPAYNTVSTNCDWFNDGEGIPYALAGDIIQSEGVYQDVVQTNTQTFTLGVIGLLILLTLFFSWVFGKR